MKFSEDILKQFNMEEETKREPVNVMKISDMLAFMKACANRICQKSSIYENENDADIQLDCIDIVKTKLNDFSQVFKDIVIFIRKSEGTYNGSSSLRYCINSYDTFDFKQTQNEKNFLKELLLRNEITHDYFNQELHQEKLVWIMRSCSDGAIDVYANLLEYCDKKHLLEKYADKNAK